MKLGASIITKRFILETFIFYVKEFTVKRKKSSSENDFLPYKGKLMIHMEPFCSFCFRSRSIIQIYIYNAQDARLNLFQDLQ